MLGRAFSILLASAAVATGTLTAAPAHAENLYEEVEFSALDTSVPGHVTGTVTSEAPYVYVDLHEGTDDDYIFDSVLIEGGTGSFDLETWSLGDSQLRAYACDVPDDPYACDDASLSPVFHTNAVDPVVTFPDDVTIGSEPYTITVSDPGGGAHLIASWKGGPFQEVNHNGQTTLDLGREGEGDLKFYRCYFPKSPFPCQPTGISHHLTSFHSFRVTEPTASATVVAPDTTTSPDVTVGLTVPSAPSDLMMHLTVTGSRDWTTFPGFEREVAVQRVGDKVSVPIDLTGLPDAQYWIGATLYYDDPEFGRITGDAQAVVVRADSNPPEFRSVAFSETTVYPFLDNYKDFADLVIAGKVDGLALTSQVYEIRGPTGEVVQSGSFGSPGVPYQHIRFNAHGLPEGAYVASVHMTDYFGRTTTVSAPITVSRKRMDWIRVTQTVSARGSLVSKTVGRCSTLASPSRHRWPGSLGLYSGSRCKARGAASKVMTIHRLKLPPAFTYGSVSLSMTGGSAKAKPSSTTTFGLRKATDAWDPFMRATRTNTLHRGPTSVIDRLRTPTNDIYWGVIAQAGSRYDVRSFTLTYSYRGLR